jgi:hypothetical protein
VAIAFLGAGAVQRFGPLGLRASVPLRFAVAAGVLALVTCPAFLVHRGSLLHLALYFQVWLVAWYTVTHRVDRFLDPATPAVALLAGVGFTACGGRRVGRLAQGLVVAGLGYALATAVLIHGRLVEVALATPREEFVGAVTEGSTYCQPAIETLNRELGPEEMVLFVGEARTFYCTCRVWASTAFDRGPIERILDRGGEGDAARRVADGLREVGVSHIYVNWAEVARLGASYGYRYFGQERNGFSRYDLRALFILLRVRGHVRQVAGFRPNRHGEPTHVIYELR